MHGLSVLRIKFVTTASWNDLSILIHLSTYSLPPHKNYILCQLTIIEMRTLKFDPYQSELVVLEVKPFGFHNITPCLRTSINPFICFVVRHFLLDASFSLHEGENVWTLYKPHGMTDLRLLSVRVASSGMSVISEKHHHFIMLPGCKFQKQR